jgi:hypothetical protein
MSIQGFIVDLSSHSYETPNCCASCMGPRETQVEARYSEKIGNIRRTLTMPFPYCEACAKRARWEKTRQIIVGLVAAALGFATALAAWGVDIGVGTAIRFAVALPLAVALATVLALATRQSVPAPPATARGEAVILRDTSGTVLCTNPQFAQLLAQGNGGTAKPGAQRMTLEAWAPLMALLCGALVLLPWLKAGAPDRSAAASTGPSTTARAPSPPPPTPAQPAQPTPAQPAQPKKPAPAAAPPAKRH